MVYRIRPALVIIDLQNCFVSFEGSFNKLGYDVSKYQKIVPVIKEVYVKAKSFKIPIFFGKALRERSGINTLDKVHKILPRIRRERIKRLPICVRGTWDSDFVEEIKPDPSDFVVEKRRDSIFQDTEFELWLKSLKIDTLIFTGVDTSICVESSLRDAFNKGWDIILLSDATSSLNDDFYNTTLQETKENFGLVMKSEEFFKILEKIGSNRFLLKINGF